MEPVTDRHLIPTAIGHNLCRVLMRRLCWLSPARPYAGVSPSRQQSNRLLNGD